MEEKNYTKLIIYGVGAVVALIVLLLINPLFIIEAGERGIVLRFGAVDRVVDEGVHWRTPFVEKIREIDVKTQVETVKAASASKDLQTVSTEVALNYNLQPDKVGDLWKGVGSEYKTRIIDPAILDEVKAATALYTAEELITKRHEVREAILLALKERLIKHFVEVVNVSLTDFDFSATFNTAIEAKVTAEQNALAAKNKLEQVKFEAEQRISQARGEAEAIRIQAQAITQQGGEDYVRLKAVEKWDGHYPETYLGSQSSIPLINIGK